MRHHNTILIRSACMVLGALALTGISPLSGAWAESTPPPPLTLPAQGAPSTLNDVTPSAAPDNNAQQQRDLRVAVPQGNLDDAIANVRQKGLMNAFPDGQFHQERSLSRAELASILVKTFKLNTRQVPHPLSVDLRDVPNSFWAANDINTVVRQGVMSGYRPQCFYPNQAVTRAEAYAIFAQAYGVQQLDDATVKITLSQYPDADQIPAWGKKAMATSLKNGFVDAPPQGKLRPLQPMTRGDIALALNQYLIRLGQPEP
jgi:hypothetical protein